MKNYIRVEIKSLSETGAFTGLLSVYNVVDQGNDVVEPGAFTKTIKDRDGEVPLLWQHRSDSPIGKLTLRDTDKALEVDGQLLMELPEAQKAYLLMKAGIVKGLSIGYEVVKKAIDGSVRRLKELRLFEGSLVTFPMNEFALVTSVKGQSEVKDDFNTELAEIQMMDMPYDMRCALACALSSIVWGSDLTRDDKITASEASIQQFSDAYMAMLPGYLDMLAEMNGGMEMMSRKAGRRISSATRDTLQACIDQLSALLAEDNSDAGAAGKSEPGVAHSAIQLMDQLSKSLQEYTQ